MRLFKKWRKGTFAIIISFSLVLASCSNSSQNEGGISIKNSLDTIDEIPIESDTDNNNEDADLQNDNSNDNFENIEEDGNAVIFVDTNHAINDLSTLNLGGLPTFGKQEKAFKILRGQAKDLDNIWAIQYSESGELEMIHPTTKSGSKYSISADLSETRGYKFVFLGYENETWTGDSDEYYGGPSETTSVIGSSGVLNELNGFSDAIGSPTFLRTSSASEVQASLSNVGALGGGLTITSKKAGIEGNSIKVLLKETKRATYFVGVISSTGGAIAAGTRCIRYRTVAGQNGNVSIQFKYHSEFLPAKSQPSTTRATGILNVQNEDFDMWEYSEYNFDTNTITVHYGPNTRLFTIALLLQAQNPGIIALADVFRGTNPGLDGQSTTTQILTSNDILLNRGVGNRLASGNEDGEPTYMNFIPGTSTIEIAYSQVPDTSTAAIMAAADGNFYTSKLLPTTAVRPLVNNYSTGLSNTNLSGLMQAYADAPSSVRDLVEVTLVGADVTIVSNTHPAPGSALSGGSNASGSQAISNFDKNTNPYFNWTDALNIFTPDSFFTSGPSTLGLRTGSSISPKNPVAFDNLFKNFTYFGILHLKPTDIISEKKGKTLSVEAKIVSVQAYRSEGNIGPAVIGIANDTFTLGSPTGEIILKIRNYYHSDISLDDLRITAGIKNANLDADSGKISVALPVPTISYTIPVPLNANVTDENGVLLQHPVTATDTLTAFTNLSGVAVKNVFHAFTSISNTPLFAHGDTAKQNFTITKHSRREFIENFQWEDETTVSLGFVPSQAAPTDTVIYDQDQDFTTASGGRGLRSSFISRSGVGAGNEGTYVANAAGEFIDIEYHLYYRPRSSVGTDVVTVFIEDGTRNPTGNLAGPRDPNIVSIGLASRIAESRSPSVGLDGKIIPFEGSGKDLIYNTLSLEIPVETVIVSNESVLEEPDALVSFSIQFDAVANSGSTIGQTVVDPSTMTVFADLINTRPGETYTYRWNWSHYLELAGDNAFIGMPAGATIRGTDKHQITFSDATGKHPEFTSIKVTIRASEGRDPEGTLRPFDPASFDTSLNYEENKDRDFVFLENYDTGTDALNTSLLGLKAACKLDLKTDPSRAHLIVTPKTNSSGEIIASASEIAEAIRYYLLNSTIMNNFLISNPNFKLMDVYAKGSTTDATPYWTKTRSSDLNGQILGNARTADDNAGSSLKIKFANSEDYKNVRDTGSPLLMVTILDTVETHNGSTFIVDMSNAYPPVLEGSSAAITDVQYSFVSLATDGVTASAKKSKTNTEQFLSVANDTDADGAVTFNMRIKRDNVGVNDTDLMQNANSVVDGNQLGGPSTRENQFVAYWEVKKVSDQSKQKLLAPGNSSLNDWVLASSVDFVGSGADGNTNSITYERMFRDVYTAHMADPAGTPENALNQARLAARYAIAGIHSANQTSTLNLTPGGTATTAGRVQATATLTNIRAAVVARIRAACIAAWQQNQPTAGLTQVEVTNRVVTGTAPALYNATSAVTGLKANLYNNLYAYCLTQTPNHLKCHLIALAAANAHDNGLLDTIAIEDKLDAYKAVYNPTYYASLGGGSTVTQAKFHADLAGNAAAGGANNANIVSLITNQAGAGAAAAGVAAGIALENRRIVVVAKIVSAITTAVNREVPPLAGQPAGAINQVQTVIMPVGAPCTGMRSPIYNLVHDQVDAASTALQAGRIAVDATIPFGNIAEDYTNLIPIEAQLFNRSILGDAGLHDATLATDPDDPTNLALQHMLFSCRLILPSAPEARDSYFVTFKFRPGVSPDVGLPPIMSNSFIITVTK